jgi:hypothetical protein
VWESLDVLSVGVQNFGKHLIAIIRRSGTINDSLERSDASL